MPSFHIIEPISLTSEGAVGLHGDPIHLRQGDMDGACGPYSLMMVLISLGIISRNDACCLHQADGRTRLGKIRDNLLAFGSLVKDGTNSLDLSWLADTYKQEVEVQHIRADTKKQLTSAIEESLNANHPIIVGMNWGKGVGGHWAVAVGYEKNANGITRLLLLDPGHPQSQHAPWNAVAELYDEYGDSVSKGPLSSHYWAYQAHDEVKMKLSEAIVFKKINCT